MSTLRQTRNFLAVYQAACGTSNVPPVYHFGAALSLISACVQDRVDLYRVPTSPIRPNLYIFLVGLAGIGKGQAIKRAISLTTGDAYPGAPTIPTGLYAGDATRPFLVDLLSVRKKRKDTKVVMPVDKSRLWMVSQELADDLPSGALAADVVRLLTKLWEHHVAPVDQGTRMHGHRVALAPIINWVAGTTRDWLRAAITPDLARGGFVPRLLVFEAQDYPEWRDSVTLPPDYDALITYLAGRCQWLAEVRGTFKIAPGAQTLFSEWGRSLRGTDTSSLAYAWIVRAVDEQVWKLAMVYALARMTTDSTSPELVIHETDMRAAQQLLTRTIMPCVTDFLEYLIVPSTSMDQATVKDAVRKRKSIMLFGRGGLYALALQAGIYRTRVDEILGTLSAAGYVEVACGNCGRKVIGVLGLRCAGCSNTRGPAVHWRRTRMSVGETIDGDDEA